MAVIGCLLVQAEASQQWLGDAELFRTSWNRLCQVRGLDRSVVVTSNQLRATTEKKLGKTPVPPTRFVEMTSTGLADIVKNLVSSGAVKEDDVVVFDRCVSPFITVGSLEACVEASSPEQQLVLPAFVEQVIFKGPGVTTLVKLPVVNATIGTIRVTTTAPIAGHVEVGRMEMLQIDRPEDMTIAHAVTMFGDDK